MKLRLLNLLTFALLLESVNFTLLNEWLSASGKWNLSLSQELIGGTTNESFIIYSKLYFPEILSAILIGGTLLINVFYLPKRKTNTAPKPEQDE